VIEVVLETYNSLLKIVMIRKTVMSLMKNLMLRFSLQRQTLLKKTTKTILYSFKNQKMTYNLYNIKSYFLKKKKTSYCVIKKLKVTYNLEFSLY